MNFTRKDLDRWLVQRNRAVWIGSASAVLAAVCYLFGLWMAYDAGRFVANAEGADRQAVLVAAHARSLAVMQNATIDAWQYESFWHMASDDAFTCHQNQEYACDEYIQDWVDCYYDRPDARSAVVDHMACLDELDALRRTCDPY